MHADPCPTPLVSRPAALSNHRSHRSIRDATAARRCCRRLDTSAPAAGYSLWSIRELLRVLQSFFVLPFAAFDEPPLELLVPQQDRGGAFYESGFAAACGAVLNASGKRAFYAEPSPQSKVIHSLESGFCDAGLCPADTERFDR